MSRSIEELESNFWDESQFKSGLVKNVHRLRKKPTEHFTVEDLRLMIGQNVGTQYLMPRALGLLEQNPLVWELAYPGELLYSVLSLPEAYWKLHPVHLERTIRMLEAAKQRISKDLKEQKIQREERTGWYADEKPYRPDFDEEMNEKLLTFIRKFLSKYQDS